MSSFFQCTFIICHPIPQCCRLTSSHFYINQAEYFAESLKSFSSLDRISVDIVVEHLNFSCLLAIFHDQKQNIKSLCQFQVIHSDDIKTDLYILDYLQIPIRNAPSLTVTCPYHVKAPKECSCCFYQCYMHDL